MTRRYVGAILGCTALLLIFTACGSDDSGGGGDDEPAAEESSAAASPDGTYESEVGPNEESVSFEVEDDVITHLEGTTYADCGGSTVSQTIESDVEIPIEDGVVDYNDTASGATTTLTGEFSDGVFEGTFTYLSADAACESEPYDFAASAS